MHGSWEEAKEVDFVNLFDLPNGSSVIIATRRGTYQVAIGHSPTSYIAGNRPVINGVRITSHRGLATSMSRDKLLKRFSNSTEFPDSASREIRLGHEWQVNDDPTARVQRIVVQRAQRMALGLLDLL
jgi:hypothetical protein